MPNSFFQFKQFRIDQKKSGMKVTTDACLFGAWVADEVRHAQDEPLHILDIGTGTGLLSLMLAQVTRKSLITAVEINEGAYEEASLNFGNSAWNERIKCLLSPIQEIQKAKYDCIICNPPFFTNSPTGSDADKNQALHAYSLSMSDLLHHVIRLLDMNGILYLLYPENEMHTFIELAGSKGIMPQQIVRVRNQADDPVFRIMTSFGIKKTIPCLSEVIIREKDRKYTTESWRMLHHYYLEYNNPEHPADTSLS